MSSLIGLLKYLRYNMSKLGKRGELHEQTNWYHCRKFEKRIL